MGFAPSARSAKVIAAAYTSFSLAIIFVALRLIVRWKIVQITGREDLTLCLALVLAGLASVFLHLQVVYGGLGQHLSTLDPEVIVVYFKYAYFCIMFYNFSLCLTKLAIVFLCMRIFALSNWYKACRAVLVVVVAYSIWVLIVSIMPCVPIPRYWDRTISGWCFPTPVLWWFNASLNILSDFLVVLLPIPAVSKSQLPRKQRLAVSLIFALGFFICIVSIVRLKALYHATTTFDPTYNFDIGVWSIIEVNGAVIGACLPTLRPLVSRIFPRLLSSTSNSQTPRVYTLDGISNRNKNRAHSDTLSETAIIGGEACMSNCGEHGERMDVIQVTNEVTVSETSLNGVRVYDLK